MTVRYGQTPRRFTAADIGNLEVRASSAINMADNAEACLRGPDGYAAPGTSYLWLRCGPQGKAEPVQLDRRQAAALSALLTRWLATGFLEREV